MKEPSGRPSLSKPQPSKFLRLFFFTNRNLTVLVDASVVDVVVVVVIVVVVVVVFLSSS